MLTIERELTGFYFQIDVISREDDSRLDNNSNQDLKSVLRLRMSPHNVPEVSRVEMMADCPIDHPFFVKDKGMSDPFFNQSNQAIT